MTSTPGPWIVGPHSDEDETLYIFANYTETAEGFARATWIAECDLQDGDLETNAANARLIAAAPDLLAALRAAEQFLTPEIDRGPAIDGWQNTVDMVRAAIAKAEGVA